MVICWLTGGMPPTEAQMAPEYDMRIPQAAAGIQPRVVEWRRNIHAHPELSNQEITLPPQLVNSFRKLPRPEAGGLLRSRPVSLSITHMSIVGERRAKPDVH